VTWGDGGWGDDAAGASSIEDESPAVASTILRDQAVAFTVLGELTLWATLASGALEMVHDGTAFTAAYLAGSSITGAEPDQDLELVRAGGWPTGALSIHVPGGDSAAWTVSQYSLGDVRWLVAVGTEFDLQGNPGTVSDPEDAYDWGSEAAATARALLVGGVVKRFPVTSAPA
jgi:hypothetical protein